MLDERTCARQLDAAIASLRARRPRRGPLPRAAQGGGRRGRHREPRRHRADRPAMSVAEADRLAADERDVAATGSRSRPTSRAGVAHSTSTLPRPAEGGVAPCSRSSGPRRAAGPGSRLVSSSSTTCTSSRASDAPRQKWIPWPNERWLRAFSRCEVDALRVGEDRSRRGWPSRAAAGGWRPRADRCRRLAAGRRRDAPPGEHRRGRGGASPRPPSGSAIGSSQRSSQRSALARAAPSGPLRAATWSSRGRRTAGCRPARRSRPDRDRLVAARGRCAPGRRGGRPAAPRSWLRRGSTQKRQYSARFSAWSHLLLDGQVAEVEVDAAQRPTA